MLLGPGDDAAMVSAPDGRVVVSTDVLIEGRHFRRHWSSGYDVGRKAAAQNLADVAAMGAVPTAIVVGLGIPACLPVTWLDALTDGFRDECALVGASVAGGDITRCDLVVIGVTVLGDLQGRPPVERSGARPGHVVAVAGRLGWSAAGLALLESGRVPPPATSATYEEPQKTEVTPDEPASPSDPSAPGRAASGGGAPPGPSAPGAYGGIAEPEGAPHGASVAPGPPTPGSGGGAAGEALEDLLGEVVGAHLRPRPPYSCGVEAARLGASAMIDVSDGLLQDLGHVAEAGGVRIDLDPGAFAVAEAIAAAAGELGADPLDWVLTGGEDHALAATFPPEVSLPASWRVVGRVSEGEGVHVRGRAPGRGGWDHFR
ncbi:thiamine-monophosphate kinase [Nonomuraea ferruginea]|uniref:Thiamine-monophosphate kinase n=1 Tax=Nonomuraea ferruginea TaxID=46174 RepID=A0ABT4TCH6_9ACTN|nr:thiamine-monophosphate kinase [Nonomuraea ferruginea]MDA0647206.1 thiamine-monophosphate kinase [Nonomuraea ferruginea]